MTKHGVLHSFRACCILSSAPLNHTFTPIHVAVPPALACGYPLTAHPPKPARLLPCVMAHPPSAMWCSSPGVRPLGYVTIARVGALHGSRHSLTRSALCTLLLYCWLRGAWRRRPAPRRALPRPLCGRSARQAGAAHAAVADVARCADVARPTSSAGASSVQDVLLQPRTGSRQPQSAACQPPPQPPAAGAGRRRARLYTLQVQPGHVNQSENHGAHLGDGGALPLVLRDAPHELGVLLGADVARKLRVRGGRKNERGGAHGGGQGGRMW